MILLLTTLLLLVILPDKTESNSTQFVDEYVKVLYEYLQIREPLVISTVANNTAGVAVADFRRASLDRTSTFKLPHASALDFTNSVIILAERVGLEAYINMFHVSKKFLFARRFPSLVVYSAGGDFERRVLLDGRDEALQLPLDRRLFFFNETSLTLSEHYSVNGVQVDRVLGQVVFDGRTYLNVTSPHGFLKRRSNLYGWVLRTLLEDQSPYIMFEDHQVPNATLCHPRVPGRCAMIDADNKCRFFEGYQCNVVEDDTYYKIGERTPTRGLFQDVLEILQRELNFTVSTLRRVDGNWGSVKVIFLLIRRCLAT